MNSRYKVHKNKVWFFKKLWFVVYYPSDRNWWSCNNLFLGVFPSLYSTSCGLYSLLSNKLLIVHFFWKVGTKKVFMKKLENFPRVLDNCLFAKECFTVNELCISSDFFLGKNVVFPLKLGHIHFSDEEKF